MTRLLAVLVASLPLVASAQLDLRLSSFGSFNESGDFIQDEAGYEALVGDLGHILGPKMLGPADTTGSLGFDVSLDISIAAIDAGSDHWSKAVDDAPSAISTIQFQFRKGLPFSFELGGTVTHVLDSDLTAVGMFLRYAPLEGFRSLPEIALRGGVSTVLGSSDMSLLLVSGDLTVSKAFGIAGYLSISPYLGYSLVYARASTYVLGVFSAGSPEPREFVIPPKNVVVHRGFLGARVNIVYASVGLEAMLADSVQIVSIKLGAEF